MVLFAMLYFGVAYEKASAGEFVESFCEMFSRACYGYPHGGWISIPRAFLDGLLRYGGRCLLRKKVKKILMKEGSRGFRPVPVPVQVRH